MVKNKLKQLTGKDFITLVQSGDHAINAVLKLMKRNGVKKVLIQDQGGWLTYKSYALRLKMKVIEVRTDYGLIDTDDLIAKAERDTVVLVNSMPGYFVLEDVEEIYMFCKQNDMVLVNDVAGAIGRIGSKVGDFIIGSFGKQKPVNLHYGGFIAHDNPNWERHLEDKFNENRLDELKVELDKLNERKKMFNNVREKIIRDLREFKILYPDQEGINVIVLYSNAIEQTKIVEYCNANGLPYTLCPRYIRVNAPAVSIEVKRLVDKE